MTMIRIDMHTSHIYIYSEVLGAVRIVPHTCTDMGFMCLPQGALEWFKSEFGSGAGHCSPTSVDLETLLIRLLPLW